MAPSSHNILPQGKLISIYALSQISKRLNRLDIFDGRILKHALRYIAIREKLVQFMDEILSYKEVTSKPKYVELDRILQDTIAIVKKMETERNQGTNV